MAILQSSFSMWHQLCMTRPKIWTTPILRYSSFLRPILLLFWCQMEKYREFSRPGTGRTKLHYLHHSFPLHSWVSSASCLSLPSYQFLTLHHQFTPQDTVHPLILHTHVMGSMIIHSDIRRPIKCGSSKNSSRSTQQCSQSLVKSLKETFLHQRDLHWIAGVNLTTMSNMIWGLPVQVCLCWRSQFFSGWNEKKI